MSRNEIYLQSEGHTGARVIEVEATATVRDLVDGAETQGVSLHEDLILFIEGKETEHLISEVLERLLSELFIEHGSKIHFHRSRLIPITVRFDAESIKHSFRPSTTVQHIKQWAVKEFKLDAFVEVDHGLKLCGQTAFLSENAHIGSLAQKDCEVCLILSPKRPVHG
jgi:hypothetical protein